MKKKTAGWPADFPTSDFPGKENRHWVQFMLLSAFLCKMNLIRAAADQINCVESCIY